MSSSYTPGSRTSAGNLTHIYLKDILNITKVVVNLFETVAQAEKRIQRKANLSDSFLQKYGFFEELNGKLLKRLSPEEKIVDVKNSWSNNNTQIVYCKIPEGRKSNTITTNKLDEAESLQKLQEQKERMKKLSVRISTRLPVGLDRVKQAEAQQIDNRLSKMYDDLEKSKKESQELEKQKTEELLLKQKQLELYNENNSSFRNSLTPQMQQQLKDMQTKRETIENQLKSVEDQLLAKKEAKNKSLQEQQQKEIDLMEKRLMALENELSSDTPINKNPSEIDIETKIKQLEQEQIEWEEKRNKKMIKRQQEFSEKTKAKEKEIERQRNEIEKKIDLVTNALENQMKTRDDKVLEVQKNKVSSLEKTLVDLEKALENGNKEIANEIQEKQALLGIEKRDLILTEREKRIQEKEDKLDTLLEKVSKVDKLEEMMKNMPVGGFNNNNGGNSSGFKSSAELKEEIQELQKILMDPNSSVKDIDAANIALEKAMDAYENTSEAQEAKIKAKQEWLEKNEPLNRTAKQKMDLIYNLSKLKNDAKILERVKRYPELRLIMTSSGLIAKKHEGDFKTYLLAGLSEDELRAIRAVLPKFRPDQKIQQNFVNNLDNKIDEIGQQTNAPRIAKKPAKKLNFKPKAGGASATDMFAEIRNKGKSGLKKTVSNQQKINSSPSAMASRPAPKTTQHVTTNLASKSVPASSVQRTPTREAAPTGNNINRQIRTLRASLDTLLKVSMSGDEQAVAQETRSAITQLKNTVSILNKPEDTGELEAMAQTIVLSVKDVLGAKKIGETEFLQAQSKFSQTLEKAKLMAFKLST